MGGTNYSELTGKSLVFWKRGGLGEVVAQGGSTTSYYLPPKSEFFVVSCLTQTEYDLLVLITRHAKVKVPRLGAFYFYYC